MQKRKEIKHSKYKNTGILFELLLRQIAVDVMNDTEDSKAVSILKKYFIINSGTELNEELLLYRALVDTNIGNKMDKAKCLVESSLDIRKTLDDKKLKREKYELIKEIKNSYNVEDFFRSRIPSYKTYASIYKLFESLGNCRCDPLDIVNSKYSIIEHLTKTTKKSLTEEEKLIEMYKNEDVDIRLLSYKILIDKFNRKYDSLSENQKILLRKYINNITNTNFLKEYVKEQTKNIINSLSTLSKKIDNKVVEIKMKEIVKQLPKLNSGSIVKDNQILTLLRCYEMENEILNIVEEK